MAEFVKKSPTEASAERGADRPERSDGFRSDRGYNSDRGERGERGERFERNDSFRRQQVFRKRNCPFTGPGAYIIDYKDVKVLSRFLSDRGKILPSRVTSVCLKKQRELALAIKRARFLALLPYVND